MKKNFSYLCAVVTLATQIICSLISGYRDILKYNESYARFIGAATAQQESFSTPKKVYDLDPLATLFCEELPNVFIYDRYTEIDEYSNHNHYFSITEENWTVCQRFLEERPNTHLRFTTESCGITDHVLLDVGDLEKIKNAGSINQSGEFCWSELSMEVSFTDASWLAATLLRVAHDQINLSFVDAFRLTAVLDEVILIVIDIILLIGFMAIICHLSKRDSHPDR